ncbi:MAG: hypothetical protein HW380_3840 [Magnetococcales bacterium]|nr:hypothetical protein [Magnetococcales bacterium]
MVVLGKPHLSILSGLHRGGNHPVLGKYALMLSGQGVFGPGNHKETPNGIFPTTHP